MMDLLIRGSMVVGTGAAGRRADVLLGDGRISALGDIRGRDGCEIDAAEIYGKVLSGKAVILDGQRETAPGLIIHPAHRAHAGSVSPSA